MKHLVSLFVACILLMGTTLAQDDLLGELQKEDSATVKEDITTATFKSTRIINMNSTEITGVGNLQFMIIHHFGEIWSDNEGASNAARLLGLNGNYAGTYMSFDYSPIRYLNLGAAFAGNGNLEGNVKIKLLRQQRGEREIPLSAALVSTSRFNALKSVTAPNNFFWNKFSFLNQLLIARKFSEELSLQVMPGWVHYNIIPYGGENSHDIFNIGIGGRYKLNDKKAITFEYARQLNMYENIVDKTGTLTAYNPNLISLGYDWDTGGHIFQFFVTNSSQASNILQLSVNPEKDKLGQWSVGFNLNRTYTVKKTVDH